MSRFARASARKVLLRAVVCVVAASHAAGCYPTADQGGPRTALSDDEQNRVGMVTISQPIFHPIVDESDDSTNIDFGKLKDVDALWDELSKPNIGAATIALSQRSFAASVAVAGPTIDKTQTQTLNTSGGKVTENTTTSTSTVAQKTPAAPAVPAALGPGSAEDRLLALLAASGAKPTLPPDVRASLVQSYRAYMQNIEAFANRGDFIEEGWLPYRVQFMLTAEPGWYTAKNDYDAVAHVAFGKDKDSIQVVSVMPTETAQVIEDLNASFRSFALALALSGGYGPVAGSAEVKSLEALAERLEGQRMNTNLIVSYPKANEVRVRVRPSLTGVRGNQRDLQPTSRLMTAIVRVPKKAADGKIRVTQAALNAMGKSGTGDAATMSAEAVTEVIVQLKGEYAPGPRDRGKGIDLSPSSTVVKWSNEWTYTATLPAWEAPKPPAAIKVSELAGAFHPSVKDAKQGFVAVAYTLSLPKDAKDLKIEVAGAADGVWTAPAPAARAGVLAVPIARPLAEATDVTLAVRFSATVPAGGGAAHELNASKLVTVPVPSSADDADKDPNVKVSGMAVDALNLKLSPGAAGDKTDVKVAPPSPAAGSK
ncbi:hypothetical protein [Humisphaera borealis]|uniref:Lipoprotein n=1 Tax=Humisphaera borealis TaxID=2807512 RepID=A0A7M2X1N8_9BACT|nr:hypothetical protein [Humisphaera borealis]QOV91051.1 hypothetical protein IPV69_06735 [Humisphaera borealis]